MTTREKADKLYQKTDILMVSSIDSDGYPYTKAVLPVQQRESIGEIYFCTNTSSQTVNNIINNSKGNIYMYTKKLLWQGCLLVGNLEIVEDMNIKKSFWQEKFKNAYAEKSYQDPDYCVVKFTPISGRYYSMYRPTDFEI